MAYLILGKLDLRLTVSGYPLETAKNPRYVSYGINEVDVMVTANVTKKVVGGIECLPRRVWHLIDRVSLLGVKRENDGGVAVVRIGGLGDILLTFPLLFNLKISNKKVVLICDNSHINVDKLFYDVVDQFIFYDKEKFKKNIFYRIKFLRMLLSKGFEKIVQAGISRQQGGADVICWAAGASDTLGFRRQPWNTCEGISDSWFNELIDGKYGNFHELQRMVMLSGVEPEDVPIRFGEEIETKHHDGRIVISVSSSTRVREWGLDKFVVVARELHKQTGWVPVFIGTGEAALPWEDAPDFPYENKIGKLDFMEFVDTLKNAALIVCNESSPMHLGVFFRRPTVAIVSGGEFNNYCKYPEPFSKWLLVVHAQDQTCFNCGWSCRYKKNDGNPFPCLSQITPETLIDRIASWESYIGLKSNLELSRSPEPTSQ